MSTEGKRKRAKPAKKPNLLGPRRVRARLFAESLIAELVPDQKIDLVLAKKFRITSVTAQRVRGEAWVEILRADTSTKEERFAHMTRALRQLYSRALGAGNHAACAGILRQLREMYDLLDPLPAGQGKQVARTLAARTTEDLTYFAQHGAWPEEEPEVRKSKRVEAASTNPLDALV